MKCEYFSLALDESTAITNIAQLIIFCIRLVNDDFTVQEELLNTIPLLEQTRGIDVYEQLIREIRELGNGHKFVSLTSDGASSMVGANIGLRG